MIRLDASEDVAAGPPGTVALLASYSWGGDVSAGWQLATNGNIQVKDGPNPYADYGGWTWISPVTGLEQLEVRATLMSGIAPSGSPLNTWLPLTQARRWQLTSGVYVKKCTIKVEIRLAATGVILDSTTVALSAAGSGLL